ncbi:unnamed protein product [Peronospora effusa]|nr:unnamed protein product [Peronospora effusa]
MLVTRPLKVLTRYSTLAWLVKSSGLQGRLGNWAALLSQWTLEIVKCKKGEDQVLGALAASITPRESVDSILSSIAPKKQSRQVADLSKPTVELNEELHVMSFDGSTRVKQGGVKAASKYLDKSTVNEAEYEGMLLGFNLLESMERRRLIICGDSNLAIRQMRGEIECKASGLSPLRAKALSKLQSWPTHAVLHVKRDWNQSADQLASAALHQQLGVESIPRGEWSGLETINRLPEVLVPRDRGQPVKVRDHGSPIRDAQEEESWVRELKAYLKGGWKDLSVEAARNCSKMSEDYEISEEGLLVYCPGQRIKGDDRDITARLVIPESLQADVLHHYHTSLEGVHQGIGRTYHRIRRYCHWRGLFRSVQKYVGQCMDCETGKGRPTLQGKSPGNVEATYPFQIIAMDHIPSLPKSHKGNTKLLIWVDLFTECVFRRFGAIETIRHDRKPGFMSDFFRAFSRMVGQRQRATMASRPQANGTAERMVQTLTRSIKIYVAEVGQRDWDENAERLTFALNTAHDIVREETPFYLVHGWDVRTTLETMLPVVNTRRRESGPRRWRYRIQSHYQRARDKVNENLRASSQARVQAQNEGIVGHEIQPGARVLLYLDRGKRDMPKNWPTYGTDRSESGN